MKSYGSAEARRQFASLLKSPTPVKIDHPTHPAVIMSLDTYKQMERFVLIKEAEEDLQASQKKYTGEEVDAMLKKVIGEDLDG